MTAEVKKLEERAAELVKRYKEYCIVPMVELFSGEDDGGNKTYKYTRKRGLLLSHTYEVLKRYASAGYAEPYGGGAYRTRVVGVYATDDGILVQFHKAVSNRYGSPVKDYGWFMSLSSLLEVKKVPLEEVISAVKNDLEEWGRELNKKVRRVRSYKVDKPHRGYVIAFCPQCKILLKPCREETPLGEVLFFVHKHQPAFIVLGKTVKCSYVQDQRLIDVVEMLWFGGERARAIELLVGAWLLLQKEQVEYENEEYVNNVRAFFQSL